MRTNSCSHSCDHTETWYDERTSSVICVLCGSSLEEEELRLRFGKYYPNQYCGFETVRLIFKERDEERMERARAQLTHRRK